VEIASNTVGTVLAPASLWAWTDLEPVTDDLTLDTSPVRPFGGRHDDDCAWTCGPVGHTSVRLLHLGRAWLRALAFGLFAYLLHRSAPGWGTTPGSPGSRWLLDPTVETPPLVEVLRGTDAPLAAVEE
jgi:hypothetical protein